MITEKPSKIKTTSSYWSQLESEIEFYSTRAKQNLKHYQKMQFQAQYSKRQRKTSMKEQSDVSNGSINQIRSMTKQQKEKQVVMDNRLKFLRSQTQRKVQSSERAKRKYQKVREIRSKSLKDKKFVQQEVSSFRKLDLQAQRQKANKVKLQKSRIGESVQNLKMQAYASASKVRSQTQYIHKRIAKDRSQSLQNKRIRVDKVQDDLERSRKKLLFFQRKNIEKGKQNHKQKILQEFNKYQLQNKKNSQRLTSFRKEIMKIHNKKQKAEEELKEYEKYLFIGSKKQNSKKNSSFYLTQ